MSNNSKRLFYLITGILCLIFPVLVFVIWIKAVNAGADHSMRVEIFRSHFPSYLQDRFATTYVSIVLLIGSIICFVKGREISQHGLRHTFLFLLIISMLFFFLNVWNMM